MEAKQVPSINTHAEILNMLLVHERQPTFTAKSTVTCSKRGAHAVASVWVQRQREVEQQTFGDQST